MTSRERVLRAITFQGPDRIPLGRMPPDYPTDFFDVAADPDPARTAPAGDGLRTVDEFGCVWSKLPGDATIGQVTVHPLADWSRLEGFPFPDYANPARYARAREAIRTAAGDPFVLASIPMSLIHRLEYLRGHEAAWTDPYEHPDRLRRLLDRLADIAIAAIDRFAEIGAHGVMSCDDWGLQDRPMVSPALFGEFWQPVYRRVYRHAHRLGLRTLLHSCGHIADLLEGLIAAELDVIQMDQQENMGVEALARRFGGRLCFWCPVDIQQTMVHGSADDVRAYARGLMDAFGSFKGGFIAQWYSSPQAVRHADNKIRAMCDEFVAYGGRFYAARRAP